MTARSLVGRFTEHTCDACGKVAIETETASIASLGWWWAEVRVGGPEGGLYPLQFEADTPTCLDVCLIRHVDELAAKTRAKTVAS